MKKVIFLLFASCTMLLSCSEDSGSVDQNASSKERKMSKDELQALYNKLINSKEYIDLEAANDAYFEKLNYMGDGSDLTNGGLKWIETHIEDTKFLSVEEAEKEQKNILKLQSLVIKDNEEWYSSFNDENDKYLLEILSE